MGGLTSFAATAFQVLGAVNTVLGAVDQFNSASGKTNTKSIERSNALALQNAQEQTALQKQQIALNAKNIEEERRAALRRAVAKQRASYGAQGIDSGSGSAQAVLLGRIRESEEDRERSQALDALKTAGADQSVAVQQRRNTLSLTQEREKNKFGVLTAGYGLAETMGSMLSQNT